jgi:hypothetical protein
MDTPRYDKFGRSLIFVRSLNPLDVLPPSEQQYFAAKLFRVDSGIPGHYTTFRVKVLDTQGKNHCRNGMVHRRTILAPCVRISHPNSISESNTGDAS